MTTQEMEQLISATLEAQKKADAAYAKESGEDLLPAARLAPPASSEEIDLFASHLKARGLSLPPSFAHFLSLHNGIENFLRGLSIRSITQMEQLREKDAGFKNISPIYPFIFASGPFVSSVAGFLPESVNDQGEMSVVILGERGEESATCENFEGFLKEALDYYESALE